MAIDAGGGAITAAGTETTGGVQVWGRAVGAGKEDRAGAPPSRLARLANEASADRKNAAWDSAMERWKVACASAVWRWLSWKAWTQASCTVGSAPPGMAIGDGATVGAAAGWVVDSAEATGGLGLGKTTAPSAGG